MFVRKRKNKKGYSIDILTAFRDKNGKPTNKQVASLGPFISFNDSELRKLVRKLAAISHPDEMLLDKSVKEVSRRIIGTPLVVERLWKELKIDRILKKISKRHNRLEFDFDSAVLLTVIQRFIEPVSKLGTYQNLEKIDGDHSVELHHLYRSLDLLSEHKDEMEKYLFDARRDIFNNSVDVVFFDTTTFYFDSQRETEFLRKGFSKDGKFADVQIVYGLMTDSLGHPIGYEYFPGNTADVKTLLPAIDGLKKRFNLGKVTIVADSGVLSRDNLKKLEEKGYRYIVAARLKKLPGDTKKEISDLERYRSIRDDLDIYETEYDGKRLVVTWSEKRALRDEKERKKLIEKLKKSLANGKKGVLSGRYSKYLKLDETPELNDKAIKEDSRFDGLLGLLTNNKDLKGESLVEKYKELWKIEESFRLMKSQLEVRPMFHWTDKRISGHLALCFIAFVVMRELERKTKEHGIKDSIGKMLNALSELQVSELDSNGEHYLLRSKATLLAERIFKAVKIKIPPSFQPIVKL